MKAVLANATVRLAIRALLAGAAVGITAVQAGDPTSPTVLKAALVAAGWAALEAFTPLNSLVSFFGPKTK